MPGAERKYLLMQRIIQLGSKERPWFRFTLAGLWLGEGILISETQAGLVGI